ncbi:phage holin family protein [Salmonella enterica]|nr:phage holin family protein [Salmonella enterica]EGZ5734962.1 phage holin family protein [Salmonella enterica]
MESNLTGTLNASLCLVTVLALFLYRRNGARYKPGIAWLSYLLMLGYALVPFRFLAGHYPSSSWPVVLMNALFCGLVLWARGNVSKILSLLRLR